VPNATKIVGVIAGAAWALLFALMLLLTFATSPLANLVAIAFLIVPALIASAAVWIAFRSGFRSTVLALAIELVLMAAAVFCFLIVAAASGG
jgi:hypothetical protein